MTLESVFQVAHGVGNIDFCGGSRFQKREKMEMVLVSKDKNKIQRLWQCNITIYWFIAKNQIWGVKISRDKIFSAE
jgi:hypothetical protein